MFESIVIHAKSANQTFDEKKNPQQRCKQHPFAIHLFSLKPWGAFVSVRTVSLWDVYTNTYTEKTSARADLPEAHRKRPKNVLKSLTNNAEILPSGRLICAK